MIKKFDEYIKESKSKISEIGKKKLQKQVESWCEDIDGFMKDYGFSKEDDYYEELENIVWNYVNDNDIVGFDSQDADTCGFIDDMINQLCNKIEN